MKHIIKKVLKEEVNAKVINLVLDRLESNRINPPYFHNLYELGLSKEEVLMILTEYFGGGFVDMRDTTIYDKKDNPIYSEDFGGQWWVRYEYDDENRLIYHESSEHGVKLDKR
jgi:hypothetical protein